MRYGRIVIPIRRTTQCPTSRCRVLLRELVDGQSVCRASLLGELVSIRPWSTSCFARSLPLGTADPRRRRRAQPATSQDLRQCSNPCRSLLCTVLATCSASLVLAACSGEMTRNWI